MRFTWNSKKRTRRHHIQGPNGKTLCLLENGGGRVDVVSLQPDLDRAMCKLCLDLQRTGKRERKHRRRVHQYQGLADECAWQKGVYTP